MLRERSSGVKRPLVLRWKNKGDADEGEEVDGETGREVRVTDALEVERCRTEVITCEIGGDWELDVCKRGDVARGVAEGVWSSGSSVR